MRLTIDKPSLSKALGHVASVVERRNTIPILSNVLLNAANNELKLTATDLDMEIVETVGARAKGQGATTVPAHMFYDIVRKLPDGADIELAKDGEQGRLTITAGPAQFSLQTLPSDDFPALSVEDNVLAILETLNIDDAERRRRLEALLDELAIKHLRKQKAYQLSGGERRRLEITRALVTEPKFLLLDEPFAGVDPIAVNDIQTIVAGLRHRGIGVLITDHNVEQTLDIVDRAYIMFEGKVQVAGSVRELVFDDRVSSMYLGPTLTTRLRARLSSAA